MIRTLKNPTTGIKNLEMGEFRACLNIYIREEERGILRRRIINNFLLISHASMLELLYCLSLETVKEQKISSKLIIEV